MYGDVNGLAMSNAGHKCGYVALHVCLECVHVCLELGSGRDVDAIMDLEINEAVTLECMELVTDEFRSHRICRCGVQGGHGSDVPIRCPGDD